jgi:DHA3 family tetracycline resistance protein-like MFS transporter
MMLESLTSSMIWTAMLVYQIQTVGLTPLQLVLLGTTMEVTLFLFEIPTGIVADVYSRRLSTIIGVFVMGASYLWQGSVPTFEALVLGNVIWGIGYTFTSGAYHAWLVDELGQERVGNAFVRGEQVARVTGVVGIGVSVALGSLHLQLPILVGGALLLISGIFLLVSMPETGFKPVPRQDRSTFGKMVDTFRDGVRVVRARPMLLRILGVGVFFGLFSEGWDRLWRAQLIMTFNLEGTLGVPAIAVFGAMEVVFLLFSIGGMEVMRRRLNMSDGARLTRVVFWLTAVMVVGIIAYGVAPSLAAALALWFIFSIARDLIGPALATWTNQHIDSSVRATVLSMQSQVDAIGQAVGGPPIGMVGQLSLRAAFVVSGLILSPALILLQRIRRDEAARESVVVAPIEG